MIKIILFDLGNVLIKIDFDAFWKSLGLSANEISYYKESYAKITRQYEKGLISTEEYLRNLRLKFDNRFSEKRIAGAFESIMQTPVEGANEFLSKILKKYHIAVASNTNELHFRKVSEEYQEIIKSFRDYYLSYKLNVMKPDRKFYEYILRDKKIEPEQILLIDDIYENVDGAIKVGMKGIVFENYEKLMKVIKQYGIHI